ncbi:MAG: glycosyltransferase family 2 protein [Flavobacteriales bacterium]
MKLSIIIVNYNVAYFLEQCLSSVFQSRCSSAIEVIVIDNASIDRSADMVKTKFPQVLWIANQENVGFSRANNQGIAMAKGEFVLLLNPDTVVEEETLSKVIHQMEEDESIGGLGVRMVDGKGNFLPESKRGLPTPSVAFYKIFGLSSLFPKSRIFGKYHLGYLDPQKTHEVDVLSGAFMCLRKSVLEAIGYLDETFFMYGEDIDLSYRITKAGFKNLYFPETTIIHYKGESTKKSSVNYVLVFYKAMSIFAKKHFKQNHAALFSAMIHLGIFIRALFAVINRGVKRIFPILWTGGTLLLGLYLLTLPWKNQHISFPSSAFSLLIPGYFLLWSSTNLLFGTYDPPFNIAKAIKGTLIGTLIILATYALLPKDLQFSRLYILLGGLWFIAWTFVDRFIQFYLFRQENGWNPLRKNRFLIIGDSEEYHRIKNLLIQNIQDIDYVHGVYVKEPYLEAKVSEEIWIDTLPFGDYDEVVFSAKNLDASKIIFYMSQLKFKTLDFKIAQPEADFIIGSNSIDTQGEAYRVNINSLSRPENLRSKRFVDFMLALIFLLLSPFIIWIYTNKRRFLQNAFNVLISRKTWIGFAENKNQKADPFLPRIKTGVLTPTDLHEGSSPEQQDKFNLIYARDYAVMQDVKFFLQSIPKLDR